MYENNQEFNEYFINLYYERFLSCLDTIIEFFRFSVWVHFDIKKILKVVKFITI